MATYVVSYFFKILLVIFLAPVALLWGGHILFIIAEVLKEWSKRPKGK